MSFHKDDGTFLSGLIVAALLVIAFCSGYTVRDRGITFKVQVPQVQRVVR